MAIDPGGGGEGLIHKSGSQSFAPDTLEIKSCGGLFVLDFHLTVPTSTLQCLVQRRARYP